MLLLHLSHNVLNSIAINKKSKHSPIYLFTIHITSYLEAQCWTKYTNGQLMSKTNNTDETEHSQSHYQPHVNHCSTCLRFSRSSNPEVLDVILYLSRLRKRGKEQIL